MKRKPTTRADNTPVRVLLLTMDTHMASAAQGVQERLRSELPGLSLQLHSASEWADSAAALEQTLAAIERADVIFVSMLFMEEHFLPIIGALQARRTQCDALVAVMSAGEVVRLTRAGGLDMGKPAGSVLTLLRKLRGKPANGAAGSSSGARQMRMLRRLPRILRYIPGTAQDLRSYFLALQYWLGGSPENLANLVRLLVARYAAGPRLGLREGLKVDPPIEYDEVGLYHPRLRQRVTGELRDLPRASGSNGTVGLLVLRSYVLAGNTAHYDAVIEALEQRGLRVIPAFASGLDARPAIERFFRRGNAPVIDALLSLTGFSLVGGPAYNDAHSAADTLAGLDVPYVLANALEFQTLQQWESSERGLLPLESTMMVAIPELDGSTGPMVFGGRAVGGGRTRDMQAHPERVLMLAARLARLVALRRSERAQRRLAIVLFNFPPGAGNAGSAAYLAVFESLHATLRALAARGYQVSVPADVEQLRSQLLEGNAALRGSYANVHAQVDVATHVRREPWLADIERQRGAAPGRVLADSRSIHILGQRFGNVFVGMQPGMGFEGDPMRLLFERGFAPTHAFAAFYRWIREDFQADAVVHFGTHGALEFMPGKQTGMSGSCWPDRLIGDLPNFYVYAANNPSEATIAKRRSAATTISYLTPPIVHAGLYRGLADLQATLERWRACDRTQAAERLELAALIRTQAQEVELAAAGDDWQGDEERRVEALVARVAELEASLIPEGLHVLGAPPARAARIETLAAIATTAHGVAVPAPALEALVDLASEAEVRRAAGNAELPATLVSELARTARLLAENREIDALLHALDGGFIQPVPGGDLLRTPDILPTGRNIHGFDPFRIPSAFALRDGARQAQRLIDRAIQDAGSLPESIAVVLWGTDNLKNEGAPIGQVLALLGARPRFDGYGRLAGAELVPLAELGRARVDVMVTVSGIFRDLLPLQMRLLAEAAWLAASADEPLELNPVRRHALAYQREHGCDLETAALRVFGNADGAYGSNVNHLIESGRWSGEDEIAETYAQRKCFAFHRTGSVSAQLELLQDTLQHVRLAYQNLESVELGVTTLDHYFDTLGGISRAVRRARGADGPPVYIGDQTQGSGTVRTLAEQVALETHTRMLNPKWYDGLLRHGYEGVRQIEAHVTNTIGWSATTGQVAPWVYQKLTHTYMLDPAMRERLAALNPSASARIAHRLIEAHERSYWQPDAATLETLRAVGHELEDRVEGVMPGVAA
jgi:magnesium chelatase subunit H